MSFATSPTVSSVTIPPAVALGTEGRQLELDDAFSAELPCTREQRRTLSSCASRYDGGEYVGSRIVELRDGGLALLAGSQDLAALSDKPTEASSTSFQRIDGK